MIVENVIEIKNAAIVGRISSKDAKTSAREIETDPDAIGRCFLMKLFESLFLSKMSLII